MASTTTPLPTIDNEDVSVISAIHCDVIENNILSRLDGLSLASLNCTSSYFNALSSKDSLWRKICTATWPSVNHPRLQQLISAVPNGHYRFFSDSFPMLTPYDHQLGTPNHPKLPSELISAVDIWYQNKLILSRVIETKTDSGAFFHSVFRVDLLDPKEILPPTLVKMNQCGDNTWLSVRDLEENLTLSWIIYDPVSQKSANFSSTKPISWERHWLPGEFDLEYATVLGCKQVGYMECKVTVTCGSLDHGELHVREVCMRVKDMDGNYLNGNDSLVSLVDGIEFGKRKKRGENEGQKIHEEYLRRKRMRYEKRVLGKTVLCPRLHVMLVVLVVLVWSSSLYTRL